MKNEVAFLKARLAYLKHGKLLVDGTEPGPGRVDAFGAARNLLFDLDTAIQRLAQTNADDAARLQLTGCYHNLLRRWARP